MADKDNMLFRDSYEAEISIIGSMLIDERCIPLVLREMKPTDFIDGTCRATYQAIQRLVLNGRPTDPVTVKAEMQGGETYARWMADAMHLTPTAANVSAYIPIAKRGAAVQRLRGLAQDISENRDYDDIQRNVHDMVSVLAASDKLPRKTAAELAADFIERIKAETKPEYLPWGIPAADKSIYAELGDMILIGGYASSGKTLLSILMALAQAKRYKVGYYSLETQPEKMADRIFAHLASISMSAIKTRDFSDKDWANMAEATTRFVSDCPITIIQAAGASVDEIAADAIANQFQVIYIDYLQLVEAPGIRAGDRYAAVTAVSRALKIFAQRNKIAVVALAQLSRPETVKKGGEAKPVPPSMHSFRESGQIEQDADAAFLLWPENPNDNQSNRILKLGKNKEGTKFSVRLAFNGATQTMVEMAPLQTSAHYAAIGRSVKQHNREEARQKLAETREVDAQLRIDDNPFERGDPSGD